MEKNKRQTVLSAYEAENCVKLSEKNEQEESAAEKSKRGRKAGAIPFPRRSLTEALKIPQVIWGNYTGAPTAKP